MEKLGGLPKLSKLTLHGNEIENVKVVQGLELFEILKMCVFDVGCDFVGISTDCNLLRATTERTGLQRCNKSRPSDGCLLRASQST